MNVIFLGAGAAKAEGAPLQSELFSEFFKGMKHRPIAHKYDRDLATWFELIFGLDVDHSPIDRLRFPTFEEVLGLIDLAEQRREGIKDFPLDNAAEDAGRLRGIRNDLILAMAETIGDKLKMRGQFHRQLFDNIHARGALNDTVFLTTNYDILADNAGLDAVAPHGYQNTAFPIDYGFPCRVEDGSPLTPAPNAVRLLKIHGSLNWLFCPVCAEVVVTIEEKGALRLVHDPGNATCRFCETLMVPIIVPPTFYKDLSRFALASTWARAERALRQARRVVFCGYSFPDADLHVKYLLKRAETNRNGPPLTVRVVNEHPNKSPQQRSDEQDRYSRFFKPRAFEWSDLTFEGFCQDPFKVLS